MRFGRRKTTQYLILVLAVLCLLLLAAFFVPMERACTLGRLPILAQERADALTETAAPQLLYNGTPVSPAGDGCLYLPQELSQQKWDGLLQPEDGWKLYATALADEAMQERAALIASGTAVQLLCVKGEQKATLSVVFTGLPVLCLTTEYVDDSGEKVRSYGQMTLLNTDGTAQSCAARFNERGSFSLAYDKKGYKLNLLQPGGENLHLPLLGMRSDDDWQLRALYTDPQKVREAAASELWNRLAADSKVNYPTSRMEYVELILDGDYHGLYLLAERLDDKTVDATGTDILYKNGLDTKASGFDEAEQARLAIFQRDGHLGKVKIYGLNSAIQTPWQPYEALMNLLYQDEENSTSYEELTATLNVENAIDWGLFKQALGLYDNDLHNMYWLARQEGESYRMYYIPYDMDLSFGHFPDGLTEEPFGLLDWGATKMFSTPALDALLDAKVEELAPRVNDRWVELREGVLSTENIFSLLQSMQETVTTTGALARDGARWPGEYNNADLAPTLDWMKQRLAMLDAYYGPAGWSAP